MQQTNSWASMLKSTAVGTVTSKPVSGKNFALEASISGDQASYQPNRVWPIMANPWNALPTVYMVSVLNEIARVAEFDPCLCGLSEAKNPEGPVSF